MTESAKIEAIRRTLIDGLQQVARTSDSALRDMIERHGYEIVLSAVEVLANRRQPDLVPSGFLNVLDEVAALKRQHVANTVPHIANLAASCLNDLGNGALIGSVVEEVRRTPDGQYNVFERLPEIYAAMTDTDLGTDREPLTWASIAAGYHSMVDQHRAARFDVSIASDYRGVTLNRSPYESSDPVQRGDDKIVSVAADTSEAIRQLADAIDHADNMTCKKCQGRGDRPSPTPRNEARTKRCKACKGLGVVPPPGPTDR